MTYTNHLSRMLMHPGSKFLSFFAILYSFIFDLFSIGGFGLCVSQSQFTNIVRTSLRVLALQNRNLRGWWWPPWWPWRSLDGSLNYKVIMSAEIMTSDLFPFIRDFFLSCGLHVLSTENIFSRFVCGNKFEYLHWLHSFFRNRCK